MRRTGAWRCSLPVMGLSDAKDAKPMSRKKHEPQRFNPELDGQGRVQSPVKHKHLPKNEVLSSPLAAALRAALGKKERG